MKGEENVFPSPPPMPKNSKRISGAGGFFEGQAGRSIILSRIARELQEEILLMKTDELLSRHLLAEDMDNRVGRGIFRYFQAGQWDRRRLRRTRVKAHI